MGTLSPMHWLLVLVIVVLIFGTKKLRNVGKDLGAAVHDFKEGLNASDKAEEKKEDTPTNTQATGKADEEKSA